MISNGRMILAQTMGIRTSICIWLMTVAAEGAGSGWRTDMVVAVTVIAVDGRVATALEPHEGGLASLKRSPNSNGIRTSPFLLDGCYVPF
jgi:hypothetical protein